MSISSINSVNFKGKFITKSITGQVKTIDTDTISKIKKYDDTTLICYQGLVPNERDRTMSMQNLTVTIPVDFDTVVNRYNAIKNTDVSLEF